jgi:23S rRNA pseudouridine1911/1915/1917 synthase
MKRTLKLPPDASGRLDRALADALGLGRAAVKRAFSLGEVRVGGRRARASDPAEPGLAVEIDADGAAGPPPPEPSAPLRVLAETPRALVVDKPAGVAVHPLAPGEGGTLANAVAARFPECAGASPAPREGGAVHRLDLETSGCVAFARDREAWEFLHAQLRGPGSERRPSPTILRRSEPGGGGLRPPTGRGRSPSNPVPWGAELHPAPRQDVEKRYLALAVGRLVAGGVCSVPLAQRGGRVVPAPDELAVDRLNGKGFRPRPAETHYEIVERFRDHTLLDVRLVTGVMHQIRVHLAYLGYPVAGDALYGGAAASLPGLSRHFLHAARLGMDAPGGGRLEAESPLPPELERVLRGLPTVPGP